MENFRILMFAPKFLPCVGGAEYQLDKLSRALVAKGVEVTILTPHIEKNSKKIERYSGVTVIRFPELDLNRLLPGVRGLGIFNLVTIKLQTIFLARKYFNKFDLVHGHNICLQTAFVANEAKKQKLPVIWKSATTDRAAGFGVMRSIPFLSSHIEAMAKIGVLRWIATTQAVSNALICDGVEANRVSHIPNGVELQNSNLCRREVQEEKRISILYLGRIDTNANRDTFGLLKAFERLYLDGLDVELAMVGGGDLLEYTRDEIKKLKSRNRIRCPGFSNGKEWINNADIFVLPSRHEGMSNALLEAMGSGLACIAYDIPPNREVLEGGKCGLLVPLDDTNTLYLKLKKLAENSESRWELGAKARVQVESKYSIDAVADMYIDLYSQLVCKQ